MATVVIRQNTENGYLEVEVSEGDFRPLYFCTIHRGKATVPYKEDWPNPPALTDHQPRECVDDWNPLIADSATVTDNSELTADNFTPLTRESTRENQLVYKGYLQLYTFNGDNPAEGVVSHFWEFAMPEGVEVADDGSGIVGVTARGP